MDTSVDLAVSRAVQSIKVLERALHGGEAWSLAWGSMEVPVVVSVNNTGVTFEATFPEVCHLTPPYPVAILKVNGEAISAKTMDDPGEGPFTVEWTMRVRVSETVAE